ncbi:MAG: uracil-DNA glycosylase [Spirochaetia bacterium]|jgi:DNA polymerase|nr:uracil-DNA glycosylase [Spirochaetia bacterium]
MKTIDEICIEYQNIVLDLRDLLAGSGFRGGRANERPKIILRKPGAGGGEGLEAIAAEIRGCRRCRLCETRTQGVPGVGAAQPLVMVIGEGPGEEEDVRGEPFVGPAGKYLDKWLESVGLSRKTNAFIANIVKCRPPGNRDPSPEESQACMPYLLRQVKAVKPKAVLALGRIAAQNLLRRGEGIGRLRGQPGIWQGLPFLATYHPSAVLRDPQLRRPVWEDLKTLQRLMRGQ